MSNARRRRHAVNPVNVRSPAQIRQRTMVTYPPLHSMFTPPQVRLLAMSRHQEPSVRVHFVMVPPT